VTSVRDECVERRHRIATPCRKGSRLLAPLIGDQFIQVGECRVGAFDVTPW
jgi:hypothetical protein